ncbi:hypothetical protein BMI86_10215 [Thioclava sp. DLFJ5-1]|uniref:hypothetical protein n=1 Tax=Thioclava sp. DLFJ5-1 TaxID=1915314 RepID=UPI0009969482|nr:hypothetical protein [Thioclava sp. DLFJ5-1]OOY20871.1 hypothetical protein BMI86_10215 [Thioclava sp. DLFJ5-1]
MTKPSNIYEKILAWGYVRIDEGVTFQEFEQLLMQSSYEAREQRKLALFVDMFELRDVGRPPQHVLIAAAERGDQFTLTLDATFKHLERVELQEARDGARKAILWATVSLLATCVIGIAQIAIAVR